MRSVSHSITSRSGQLSPPSLKQGRGDTYRFGTTPNFTRVAVNASDDLQNQIKPITITAATERWAFGHVIRNQPIETLLTLL